MIQIFMTYEEQESEEICEWWIFSCTFDELGILNRSNLNNKKQRGKRMRINCNEMKTTSSHWMKMKRTYGLFISVEYFFFGKKVEAMVQLDVGDDALAGRRDGQWKIPEGIKRHAAVATYGALQSRLELANK